MTGVPGGRFERGTPQGTRRAGELVDGALGEVVGTDVGVETPDERGESGCLVDGDI